MNKPLFFVAAIAVAAAPVFGAWAHPPSPVAKVPPGEPYKEVSTLVKLPSFIPGMGQLWVDPKTLPAGPFLSYDRDGNLVSTIYMIPTAQMTPQMHLDNLLAPGGNVDHVDMMFNAGHPGVTEPHIHVILWHVPSSEEARVAK